MQIQLFNHTARWASENARVYLCKAHPFVTLPFCHLLGWTWWYCCFFFNSIQLNGMRILGISKKKWEFHLHLQKLPIECFHYLRFVNSLPYMQYQIRNFWKSLSVVFTFHVDKLHFFYIQISVKNAYISCI